jgi:hypothetical protein
MGEAAPNSTASGSPACAAPFGTVAVTEGPWVAAGCAPAAGAAGAPVVEMMRLPGNAPAAAAPRGLPVEGDSSPADRASARSCCNRRLFSVAAAPSFVLRGHEIW